MRVLSPPAKYQPVIVFTVFAGYLVLAAYLYGTVGTGTGALMVAPVLTTALFFNVRIVVLMWVTCLFTSTVFLNAAGVSGLDAIVQNGGGLGALMLLVVGTMIASMLAANKRLQEALHHRDDLDQEIQNRNRELEALQRASVQLTSSLELQPILASILKSASDLVHAENVHVFLFDGEHLSFGAAVWDGLQQSQPFHEPRPGGLTYIVAEQGESHFIPDVNDHPLYQNWQWGGAVAALPLKIDKQVLGVMNIAFTQPHPFDTSERRILGLFADQAAVAIQNARMYETVQNDAANLEQHVIQRTAELSEAKKRAEAVLNNSFDAIALFSPETGIEHTNAAFLSLFGYETDADVLHKPITTIVHPDVQEAFMETLQTVITTQQPARQEILLQGSTGSRIAADVALAPTAGADCNHPMVICSIRDITIRKNAEERQEQMSQNLRTVLAIANDLLTCPDLDSILRAAVEALRDKLGVERCAIFTEHGDFLQGTYGTNAQGETTDEHGLCISVESTGLDQHQRIKPGDPQWIASQSRQTEWDGHQNRTIGEGWISITRIQSADGFRAVLFNDNHLSRTPLNETLQEVIVIFCTLLGKIIERKQVEENIQRALDKETELSDLKTRFITTISHEFRTPLSVILSSQQLIQVYYDRMEDEKKKKHLQKIEDQVKWMVRLLENVLTISRADKIGLDFNPQPIDLIPFCTTLADEVLASSGSTHRFVFTHPIPDHARHYWIDEKLLHTIIINLLSNALKYSPSGSHIQFDIKTDGDEVILTVKDEGIGIPEKDFKYLFQEFYRAKNVGAIPGTGLGLSIVKRAAEAHGGSVHVESTPGTGTTFTVTLKQQPPQVDLAHSY